MRIHNYNPATGEYIGAGEASESPREPGVYLIPANAATAEPPEAGEHQAAVWNAETKSWQLVPDHRGVYYDKITQERHEITGIGIEPAADWTDNEPTDADAVWSGTVWEVPFNILKGRKAAEIQARSNSLISAIRHGYTDGEVQTFEQQNQGAKDILSGNETTPEAQFVLALLTGRLGTTPTPEEKTAFAERIRTNYDAAATATAQIVGTQQRLELAARSAADETALNAITWPDSRK